MDEQKAREFLEDACRLAQSLRDFNNKYKNFASVHCIDTEKIIHIGSGSECIEDLLHLTTRYYPVGDGLVHAQFEWDDCKFWHGCY